MVFVILCAISHAIDAALALFDGVRLLVSYMPLARGFMGGNNYSHEGGRRGSYPPRACT